MHLHAHSHSLHLIFCPRKATTHCIDDRCLKSIQRKHTLLTHTHCSHTDTHTCAAHSRVFQSAVKTAQLSVGGTSSTLQPAALCICPPPFPFVCPSQLPFRLSLLSAGVRALWLRVCLEESQVLVWHGEGCLAWGRGQSWLSAPGPGTTPGSAHSSSLSQTGTLVGD